MRCTAYNQRIGCSLEKALMRQLLRNVFWLSACLVLMISAAILVRRQLPPTPYALLFTLPNGTPCSRPCLFGARAGETSYQAALDLLTAHPLTRDLVRRDRVSTMAAMFEGVEMIVEVQGDAHGKLLQISLHIEPSYTQRLRSQTTQLPALPEALLKGGTMGETFAAIGAPDYVRLDGGRELRLYYQFDGLTFYFRRSNERLNPQDGLTSVFMYSLSAPETASMLRWIGFTSSERYYLHAYPR